MPINEKEYNGILFDQLSLLEDIEVVAESENAEETLKLLRRKRRQIERKLYQQPPLACRETEKVHSPVENIRALHLFSVFTQKNHRINTFF